MQIGRFLRKQRANIVKTWVYLFHSKLVMISFEGNKWNEKQQANKTERKNRHEEVE